MEDELARQLEPVRREEPAREEAVDRPVEEEVVPCDEPADLVAEGVRVAQAAQDPGGELRGLPRVLPARPVGGGLPEVVEQRGEADRERRAEVRRRLHDREEVLVERERLARGAELVADHGPVLRQHLDEDAGVPREPQGEGGPAAEQELRELPQPVRLLPAADPLGRDVPQAAGARAHLVEGLVGELEVELRDEPQAAEDAQRILLEALGRDRAQEPLLEIDAAAERVDELVRLEPLRHRVDREVAARHVVLDRDRGIATISKSRCPGPTLRSRRGGVSSMPAGASARTAGSRGWNRTPTSWPCTSMSSTRPWGSSAARRPAWSSPGTRKSSSACGIPSSSSRTAPPTT